MKSRNHSTKACVFVGTPVVAFRVTNQRKPNVARPRIAVMTSVSTLIVQNEPCATGCVRNVRWCWMYSVGDWAEASIGGTGELRASQSRTNRATRNSSTVTMKAAINAGSTASRYVESTSHSSAMITRIFAASARNIAAMVAPADLGGATASTNAYTTPADRLITPPRTAESAPCTPTHDPAMTAMMNVAAACQSRTARYGFVENGLDMRHRRRVLPGDADQTAKQSPRF